jgi:3-oxoacyl-[acyl-carrier-protein] synthase II
MRQSNHRRVVITGIGAVTPLGTTFIESWNQLCVGHCGITSLSKALQYQNYISMDLYEKDTTILQPLSCQVAAAVPNFVSPTSKNTSRVVQLSLSAAKEAIQSAGLIDWWGNEEECKQLNSSDSNFKYDNSIIGDVQYNILNRRRQRTGVSIGTGMSGVRDLVNAVRTLDENDGGNIRKISPYLVPTILGNASSSRIAIQYGLRGPNVSATTACAAGSHAIGDATRYIQSNMADIMIAGGAEACIDPLSIIGFHRLRALATQYNTTPEQASRPFDMNRDGFVIGEGACILVLEELNHAIHRFNGIPPSLQIQPPQDSQKQESNDQMKTTDEQQQQSYWIELIGYGATGDGHHITSPDPSGRGAIEAMQQSIQEATSKSILFKDDNDDDLIVQHVDYVNAHATSTPIGDEIEANAIQKAFTSVGKNTSNHMNTSSPVHDRIYVSSTKGATGHLLGAAGAIEAAFTIQSLIEQKVIPTLNLENLLPIDQSNGTTELVFVQGAKAIQCPDGELNVAMSNSFGFGGTNSSLTFRRMRTPP